MKITIGFLTSFGCYYEAIPMWAPFQPVRPKIGPEWPRKSLMNITENLFHIVASTITQILSHLSLEGSVRVKLGVRN